MAVIKKLKAVKKEQNHLLGIQDLSFSQVSEILKQAKTFITLNRSSSKKILIYVILVQWLLWLPVPFVRDLGTFIFLAFLFGSLQYAPGFICLTLGSRTTESAKVGIFAFSEAIAGPLWAWIFVNENPSIGVFIGGTIIFLALLLKSFKK